MAPRTGSRGARESDFRFRGRENLIFLRKRETERERERDKERERQEARMSLSTEGLRLGPNARKGGMASSWRAQTSSSRPRGVLVRRSSYMGDGKGGKGKGGQSLLSTFEDTVEFGQKVYKFISEQFDYEAWAPRSARAWRLGVVPEAQTKQENQEVDELVLELQEKMREQTRTEDTNVLVGALDGKQLKEMMLYKYGVLYDMNFKCVNMPMKRILSLNIMWSYYGQKSFPMNEAQYEMKLEGIAEMVRQLNRENVIREFFAKEPTPERGLPARPVVGTAVIIRLSDVEESVIDELFP